MVSASVVLDRWLQGKVSGKLRLPRSAVVG